MKNFSAVILAAGEGTRMNSNIPKILHKLGNKPMLGHVLDTVQHSGIKNIFVITGYRFQLVEEYVRDKAVCVQQRKLLGTADAVWQLNTQEALKKKDANLLIIYGDTPLIKISTIKELIKKHTASGAACTLLTTKLKDPTGYGRIVRNETGEIKKIVEEQDASVFEKAVEEINVGVYLFKTKELFAAIKQIKPDNQKKEYYLTDVIEILNKDNFFVDSIETIDLDEILGVNSRMSLVKAYEILRQRIMIDVIAKGVTIMDPRTTFIDEDVCIGRDTVIYPFTVIEKNVVIGENCSLGPFCRIRSGCKIADDVSLGNFVEINRSSIGKSSRIKHQGYLGDTIVGDDVNIGAGTIVANFDGKNKNQTIIEEGAFIGTGTILVAPVKVGKKAVTGAGTVVPKNKNVPEKTIVIGVPARELKKKE